MIGSYRKKITGRIEYLASVFGRSNESDEDQAGAYRILNSSYHNLSIMTYDHVLARAKRLLGLRTALVRM